MTQINAAECKACINRMIAEAPTPYHRSGMQSLFTTLLMGCKVYNGFEYVDWAEGGFSRWVADGKPMDNTKYLGDQTKIRYL